jgi:hypothetical protein
MAKLGKLYEKAVAAVMAACAPKAQVSQGRWISGPDGRRELDVLIENPGPPLLKVLVECKDFDPRTTGPVGIGYVDAIDSKRRDLSATHAIICSHAGFAKPLALGLASSASSRKEIEAFASQYSKRFSLDA